MYERSSSLRHMVSRIRRDGLAFVRWVGQCTWIKVDAILVLTFLSLNNLCFIKPDKDELNTNASKVNVCSFTISLWGNRQNTAALFERVWVTEWRDKWWYVCVVCLRYTVRDEDKSPTVTHTHNKTKRIRALLREWLILVCCLLFCPVTVLVYIVTKTLEILHFL